MTTATAADPLPGIHTVGKLYLELLFRCNFSCTICYHGTDLARPDTLTRDQAETTLAYFADQYHTRQVCLLGGEPLLHPDLPAILADARRHGYTTEICTNGYKRRAALTACLPHLDRLRISLDAGTPTTHDAIRRPGSFTAALNTLDWAIDQGLPVGVTCTLTATTLHTIPHLAQLLHQHGADELTLHRVRPVGNAAHTGTATPTWEQTIWLHDQLTTRRYPSLTINTDILLPERCPTPTDVIDKLEIAPDGRVYLTCAQVAGPGSLRYDFDHARLLATSQPA